MTLSIPLVIFRQLWGLFLVNKLKSVGNNQYWLSRITIPKFARRKSITHENSVSGYSIIRLRFETGFSHIMELLHVYYRPDIKPRLMFVLDERNGPYR
jgi:hypothetical protein